MATGPRAGAPGSAARAASGATTLVPAGRRKVSAIESMRAGSSAGRLGQQLEAAPAREAGSRVRGDRGERAVANDLAGLDRVEFAAAALRGQQQAEAPGHGAARGHLDFGPLAGVGRHRDHVVETERRGVRARADRSRPAPGPGAGPGPGGPRQKPTPRGAAAPRYDRSIPVRHLEGPLGRTSAAPSASPARSPAWPGPASCYRPPRPVSAPRTTRSA